MRSLPTFNPKGRFESVSLDYDEGEAPRDAGRRGGAPGKFELARGGTLTDAAHAAGYSDSAHLSRVFRATFGFRPSALGPRPRWAVGDLPLA